MLSGIEGLNQSEGNVFDFSSGGFVDQDDGQADYRIRVRQDGGGHRIEDIRQGSGP